MKRDQSDHSFYSWYPASGELCQRLVTRFGYWSGPIEGPGEDEGDSRANRILVLLPGTAALGDGTDSSSDRSLSFDPSVSLDGESCPIATAVGFLCPRRVPLGGGTCCGSLGQEGKLARFAFKNPNMSSVSLRFTNYILNN